MIAHQSDCLTEGFLDIIKAFAQQVDFTNYDSEVAHASMRTLLNTANGKSFNVSVACMIHMGQEVGRNHGHGVPAAEQNNQRGRPKLDQAKRLRYDGWNAYVAVHPPCCDPRGVCPGDQQRQPHAHVGDGLAADGCGGSGSV